MHFLCNFLGILSLALLVQCYVRNKMKFFEFKKNIFNAFLMQFPGDSLQKHYWCNAVLDSI